MGIDVGGGQREALTQLVLTLRTASGDGCDHETAVVSGVDDAEGLPVDRAAPVSLVTGQIPRVLPRLDEVAAAGVGALQSQPDGAGLVDVAEVNELGA